VSDPSAKHGQDNRVLADLLGDTLQHLRVYLRRQLGNPHEADDLAQETALRVWRSRDGGAIDNPRGLLFRVARNLVIDHRRQARRRPVADDRDLASFADEAPSPERQLGAREELAVVRAAMAALPDPHRRALDLYLDGWTHARIGDALGVSQKTATNYINRALAQLGRARHAATHES
jgi:RNA polymerase sigma factor (sigma-70 family)